MNLKLRKTRASRQQTTASEWDANIELLAMQLCPTEEWQLYEKRMQTVARKAGNASSASRPQGQAKVRVFPVWRKYRQQAKRVATLHQALPMFKRLPLAFSGFVGDLLFK